MNITDFISNVPSTTRERKSEIRDAVTLNKVYVSVVKKNNTYHFKLYFKNGDAIKSKQLKVTPLAINYIHDNRDITVLSDDAQRLVGND